MSNEKDTEIETKKLPEIAEKIQYYRRLKAYSQESLARNSDVNISSLKKYEAGYRNPKPDQLVKIAEALGISANYLIEPATETADDILALVQTLVEHAGLEITAERDENKKIIPDSIRMSFRDDEMNRVIAEYLDSED